MRTVTKGQIYHLFRSCLGYIPLLILFVSYAQLNRKLLGFNAPGVTGEVAPST